jgi:hypothetical protein
MSTPPPEVVRLLAEARLRRHGWDRFQAGSRRAALRVIRTRLNNPDPDTRPTTTG